MELQLRFGQGGYHAAVRTIAEVLDHGRLGVGCRAAAQILLSVLNRGWTTWYKSGATRTVLLGVGLGLVRLHSSLVEALFSVNSGFVWRLQTFNSG